MKVKRFFARNKVILILVTIVLLCLLYYVYLHRHPRTDNAFVVGNTIPISALVPGYITDIYVVNNQQVKKGDKLFTVYKKPYELALAQLQADLKATHFTTLALQSEITVNQLQYDQALAQYNNAKYLFEQSEWLYKKNAVSQQETESLMTKFKVADSALKIATGNLDMVKNQYQNSLATEDSLTAQVENAKVNLQMTTVYAQSNGIVSNMYITKGVYAAPGTPMLGSALFSFTDTDTWWIQANMKETELNKVEEGQKVWIKLWIYPEEIFEGKITKIGWNVNRQNSSTVNFLQDVQDENDWFLLPQRFPVQIEITDKNIEKYPLHVGLTATVVIDTKDNIWRHLFWQIDWW